MEAMESAFDNEVLAAAARTMAAGAARRDNLADAVAWQQVADSLTDKRAPSEPQTRVATPPPPKDLDEERGVTEFKDLLFGATANACTRNERD